MKRKLRRSIPVAALTLVVGLGAVAAPKALGQEAPAWWKVRFSGSGEYKCKASQNVALGRPESPADFIKLMKDAGGEPKYKILKRDPAGLASIVEVEGHLFGSALSAIFVRGQSLCEALVAKLNRQAEEKRQQENQKLNGLGLGPIH